jgi:hypothetical protein
VRYLPLLLLVSSVARAGEAPDWTRNAFTFGLDYGYGIWQLDRNHLAAQVGQADADTFVNEAQNTQTATVRIGFDILGYATVEGALTGTGWNLGCDCRGGGGFLPILLALHPLRFFVTDSERHFDVSLFGGVGYGIMGQDRGADGLIEELGVRVNYFFNAWFSLTAFSRWVFLGWKTFYVDYNHRDQPGASEPLPQGSGGDFWTLGAGIEMRFAP